MQMPIAIGAPVIREHPLVDLHYQWVISEVYFTSNADMN